MTEEEVGALEEALASASEEIARHQETIASQEARLGELESALDQAQGLDAERERVVGEQVEVARRYQEEAEGLKGHLAQAVSKYRELLVVMNPEVPTELVSGETVAEVDASWAQAQNLVRKIKEQMEAKVAAERVPLGSPIRRAPDLSALSPGEKIAYALARG